MNVGDIVRISSTRYPTSAVEGVVTNIEPKALGYWVTIRGIFNVDQQFSTVYFDIKVIRRVEPEEVGSVFIDKDNVRWTKFTDNDNYNKQWISEYCFTETWKNITE